MKINKTYLLAALLLLSLIFMGCSTKPAVTPEKEVKIYDSEAIRHYMNGEIYALHGNYAMAVLEFQDAAKIDTTSSTIFNSLGEAYIQIGKLDNAKKVLQKSVEIDSLNYLARKNLTDIQYSEGNMEFAEKEYKKLAEHMPDEIDIDYKLADIYLRSNRIVEALTTYENIFRKDRSQIPALERAAEILFLSKNFQKAATYFDFLSQLDPENTDYLKTRADLALMTNNVDKAIEIYRTLIELLPEDQQIKDNLGEILSQIRDEKYEPLKYLKSMIKSNPDNLDYYKNLIFFYVNNDEEEKAIATLDTVTQRFSEDSELYFILGSIYRNKNDNDKALVYLDKALMFAEDSLEIIHLQATIFEENGTYTKSDSLYNEIIKNNPDDPVALNNFAYSLATRKKDLDKALGMVDKALELVPDNASYLDTKGWILYELEKYDEAEVFLQKAYDAIGDNPEILEHLGDLKKKQKNDAKALEYYNRALELDPDNEILKQKISE